MMTAEDAGRQERERRDGSARSGWAACCGPERFGTAEGCPCAGAFKSHRVACVVVLTVAALAFLVSQLGGVLGIVAFFRTL
jgi:hypothetical protein